MENNKGNAESNEDSHITPSTKKYVLWKLLVLSMNYYSIFFGYMFSFCKPSWCITVWTGCVVISCLRIRFFHKYTNRKLKVLTLIVPFPGTLITYAFSSFFLYHCVALLYGQYFFVFGVWTSLFYLKGTNPSFPARLICLPVQVLQVNFWIVFLLHIISNSLSLILTFGWGRLTRLVFITLNGVIRIIKYNVRSMYKIVKIAYHLLWRPPHFREMYTFSVSCLVEASANASLVSFYSCMNVFDVSLVSKFLSFCRTHALQQNGVENIEAPPNSDATKKKVHHSCLFSSIFCFFLHIQFFT